jgi:hypothetical protein
MKAGHFHPWCPMMLGMHCGEETNQTGNLSRFKPITDGTGDHSI